MDKNASGKRFAAEFSETSEVWDGVQAWFDVGKAVCGANDPKAAAVHTFTTAGRKTAILSRL